MLHGEIRINSDHIIGEWSAVNQYAVSKTHCVYQVHMEWRNLKGEPMVADFLHTHEVGRGALVLAGELLLECAKRSKVVSND